MAMQMTFAGKNSFAKDRGKSVQGEEMRIYLNIYICT